MIRRAAAVAGMLLAAQAPAQVVVPPAADPGAIQQRQIDEERRRQDLERLQREPVVDPVRRDGIDKPAPGAAPEAVRFLVREIEFTPSEILGRDELEAIARDYRGRQVSFAELQQLAERVNALYREKGVVTARAVIPPQDVSSGVVRVRLVEGRVGALRIQGNETTAAGYVEWRLRQPPGRLVDLPGLEEALIRFNRTTDVQLRAELKPGEKFGTTDIHLTAVEPPRHDLRFYVDNGGSPSTGKWRQGLSYTNRSVLGLRDDLALSTVRADGHEGHSAAYGLPFNPWGGRITLAYYKDYTEIEHGPIAPLDVTGESEAQVVSVRQPVWVARAAQLDLTAGAKKRISANWISGVFLQRTKTRDVSLGAELQLADARGYWLAAYGITSGRAEVVTTEGYDVWRGSLRRVHDFGAAWSGRASLSFQHTSEDLLPSSEQFFIGGEGSVRGYPVGSYAGDQGYLANLELHHPLGSSGEVAATGFFFLDHGYVRPFRPPNSSLRAYERLSSVGWGLNAVVNKRVSLRLTYAYALNDLPLEPRRYQIHFQVVASAF
jgi:hemolysin activation/secretion protein